MGDSSLIMHIVGNRPQFIKLAPLFAELHKRGYKEMIVHSGQHYDVNMSDIFFEELNIPTPDINLHIAGGTHTTMTANMMLKLEKVIAEYKPSIVIIYGDTNTTLAGALVAGKLNVPIAHVEAGIRTNIDTNPEELNRIIADRISRILFVPDKQAKCNLNKEGLGDQSYFVGDIMYDSFLQCKDRISSGQIAEKYYVFPNEYVLMTWHRQENTSERERMLQILELIKSIPYNVLLPLHPRTHKMLHQFDLWEVAKQINNLKIVEPVGYQEMVALTSECKFILTDSGGLSKEAYYANVRCLYMFGEHVWLDLENSGYIIHVEEYDKMPAEILDMCNEKIEKQYLPEFFGNGHTAEKIVNILEESLLI